MEGQNFTAEDVKRIQIERAAEQKAREAEERKVAHDRAWELQQAQLSLAIRERAIEKAMSIKGQGSSDTDPDGLVTLAMRIEGYLKDGK